MASPRKWHGTRKVHYFNHMDINPGDRGFSSFLVTHRMGVAGLDIELQGRITL